MSRARLSRQATSLVRSADHKVKSGVLEGMNESARQRRVKEEGDKWEAYVARYLKNWLSDKSYGVYRERELPEELKQHLSLTVSPIWSEIDLRMIGDERTILGDVDIVIARKERPLVIVSCKLSLHNRLTETLFWSIVYQPKGIRVVLATPDRGQGGKSEWGHRDHPNKNRLLARRFLAGVYVENHPDFCPETVETHFGDIIKPLCQLPKDVLRWYPSR